LLLGLLLLVPSGIGATQDARPYDPALVQQFIDGDAAVRKQIASSLTGDAAAKFRTDVQSAGSAQMKQGRSKEAIAAFEAALDLAHLMNAPQTEISALINLGLVNGQSGNYAAAVRYLTGALEKADNGRDDALIAAAANNLGNVYRRRGEFDKALDVLQRALTSNDAAGREQASARTLNNIGAIYQDQGDFRRAIEYYLRSLAIKERIGPPEEVITTLGNIGSVYFLQGNGPQAVDYMERSLTTAERLKDVRGMIGVGANLGRVLMGAGRYEESEARLNHALELARQASYADQLGGILNALANLEILRKQWTRAADHLVEAKTLFEHVGDPINIGQVLLSQASMAMERGRGEESVIIARQARDTFATVGRSTALLDAEVLLGETLTNLRRWPEAIATYQRAIELTERGLDLVAGDLEDRFRYLEGSANAYVGLTHAYAASGRGAEALIAAERGRARTLIDMMSGGSGDDTLTPGERDRQIDLDTELNALNQRIAAERARTRSGARLDPSLAAASERLRRSRDEFYLGLDANHPQLAFARGRAPVLSAEEIASALPAKSALVELVTGPRGSWIMLLAPKANGAPRLIVKPVALTTARLKVLAEDFTRQVSTRDLSFSANGRALYDALFGAIDAELAPYDQLIVVPHAALWEVPFQALQTPRQKYLVEEHAIAYAPSASALKSLESRKRPRAAQPRVIAFGDPKIDDAQFADLPNAAREARDVAAVYGPDAIVATGAEASETRFRQLAPRADIVHIATHGVLDNASPLFSYLMLSGTGTARSADGRLEGRELINLDLGADLVVLSACETARGRISNGEGVVGLSWALFAAGASTTTVSLWPVDSASTTDLMSAFHRERSRLMATATPAATAQALRAAQQRALARPESRHPFYWAGFVVIGVP